MKKLLEPVTKSIKEVSEVVTKTITETSTDNNKAPENLNNKLLEIMNDRGIIASYLLSPLSKINHTENTTQFKLLKDSSSNGVNELLINNSIPITLHDRLLIFGDGVKKFELKGDLLKLITKKNYNVDLASSSDKKLLYVFAKQMYFNVRALGNKSIRDKTPIYYLSHQV